MPKFMYAACDGGGVNTLAGGGGIVEIMLEPEVRMRYFEFPDKMGGSTHFVLPTPDQRSLVASSANIAQIFVFPRSGESYDFENYRRIGTFSSLGPPLVGTDNQTAMFDFWDNDHIITQYKRQLVKVNIYTGALEVIADFSGIDGVSADLLHQVTVTSKYVVADDVVKGGVFVLNRLTNERFFMGDGFSGGHHLVYEDEAGDTIALRPSFGFQSVDAHLKIDDNTISFYNLDKRSASTFYYGWEIPNHHPTDMVKEGGHLYISFAIPGSVCKIDLSTGRVVARFDARPGPITRYLSMLLDSSYYLLDYTTMRNRHDIGVTTPNVLAHAYHMGRLAGTRAGFFAMGFSKDNDVFYVCHRGLNKIFCLRKNDLKRVWAKRLPSRGDGSPMVDFWHRWFPYFRRCLGVHHGILVDLPS